MTKAQVEVITSVQRRGRRRGREHYRCHRNCARHHGTWRNGGRAACLFQLSLPFPGRVEPMDYDKRAP